VAEVIMTLKFLRLERMFFIRPMMTSMLMVR
jgi:hypothetical protein